MDGLTESIFNSKTINKELIHEKNTNSDGLFERHISMEIISLYGKAVTPYG